MKVFYINSNLESCYHVRCLLPLMTNGWDGDRTSVRSKAITHDNKAKAALDSEIVVFHRPDDKQKLKLARTLKKEGKKIVFDNDDTYRDPKVMKLNKYMNEERLKRGLKAISDVVDEFIMEADLVTCSTEFLKAEYDKLNSNVVVLPNCIDPFYFDEPIKNDTDVVRIGITGSIGITADLELCIPIVEHFKDRKGVKIVMFSMPPKEESETARQLYYDEYKFIDANPQVEWHPFVNISEYYDKLNELRLDIMIIPRADNYFNRCKSNLKFLEASMLEIPTIAQSFPDGLSPYEVNPEDAKHLILATDTRDWIEKIEDLIKNKEKREKLGITAYEYVKNNYNIEDKAYLWEQAYQKLL